MTLGALDVALASGERARRNPLDHVRLTMPQLAFASCADREAVWRDGNQLGKSFALAWLLLHLCRGTHPNKRLRRRVPIKALVVSVSYEQMVPLMEKIWTLCPKDEIDPRNGFEEGRGITGKPPRIVFTSGPGKGSVITFATYKAGTTRVAGGTYDVVVLDEPPTEGMYGEVRPRILRRRGLLRIGMTPTPDMPDVSWLRERVVPVGQALKAGQVREFNFGLKAENLQPPGHPRPWLDQQEIDEYAAGLLANERLMRTRGDWEAIVTGHWLDAFDELVNVVDLNVRRDLPGWKLLVGLDHGTPGEGRQAAMLIAAKDGDTPRPKVAWCDESVAEGFTTPEHDAQGILDMLERNGLTYDDVDDWIGDVPASSEMLNVTKSNAEVRKWLAIHLGRQTKQLKRFAEPQKFERSDVVGLRTMNTIMSRRDEQGVPDGRVSRRCPQFIAACKVYKGNRKAPEKDVLDSGRYPMERAIQSQVAVLNARY